MPASYIPQRSTPFDVKSAARAIIPKRYPIAGFATLGVYFVGTLIVGVIRFGPDLQGPVSDLTPAKPPAFGGSGLKLPEIQLDQEGNPQPGTETNTRPNVQQNPQLNMLPAIPDLEQFRPPPTPPSRGDPGYPQQETFPSYQNPGRYTLPRPSPEQMLRDTVAPMPSLDPRVPVDPYPYGDPYGHRYYYPPSR